MMQRVLLAGHLLLCLTGNSFSKFLSLFWQGIFWVSYKMSVHRPSTLPNMHLCFREDFDRSIITSKVKMCQLINFENVYLTG